MKRAIYPVVLLALFFAPVLPTSSIFQLSIALYEENDPERIGLSTRDVDDILRVVASHDSFGHDPAIPRHVSAFDYFVSYRKFGFLGLGRMPLHLVEDCPSCTAAAEYGMICGGLCGSGTILFLLKSGDTWVVHGESNWVS